MHSEKETKFHLRVRAIIRDGEHILAVKAKGLEYCFLPGGHHEIGESLPSALLREIKEEMGLDGEIRRYLGVVENGWQGNDAYHQEINHVFEVAVPGIHAQTDPPSAEEKLEFYINPHDFSDIVGILLEANSLDFDQWEQVVNKGLELSYNQTILVPIVRAENDLDSNKNFRAFFIF